MGRRGDTLVIVPGLGARPEAFFVVSISVDHGNVGALPTSRSLVASLQLGSAGNSVASAATISHSSHQGGSLPPRSSVPFGHLEVRFLPDFQQSPGPPESRSHIAVVDIHDRKPVSLPLLLRGPKSAAIRSPLHVRAEIETIIMRVGTRDDIPSTRRCQPLSLDSRGKYSTTSNEDR